MESLSLLSADSQLVVTFDDRSAAERRALAKSGASGHARSRILSGIELVLREADLPTRARRAAVLLIDVRRELEAGIRRGDQYAIDANEKLGLYADVTAYMNEKLDRDQFEGWFVKNFVPCITAFAEMAHAVSMRAADRVKASIVALQRAAIARVLAERKSWKPTVVTFVEDVFAEQDLLPQPDDLVAVRLSTLTAAPPLARLGQPVTRAA